MKRIVLSILILTGAALPDLKAQVRQQSTPVSSQTLNRADLAAEKNELEEISGLIDRFIKFSQAQEWGKANEAKHSLMISLQREIQQSRRKLAIENRRASRGESLQIYEEGEDGELHKTEHYMLRIYEQRFEEQQDIFRKLRAKNLIAAPNKWKSAKEHEQLMLRFERTLKEEIRQMKNWK